MKTKWSEQVIIDELSKLKSEGLFNDGFTQRLLRALKRKDLVNAIDRSGFGFAYFQEKLGYEPSERPKGYWDSLENVLNDIRPLISDNKLPTLKFLKEKIGSRIANAIAEHGGVDVIAEKLNCRPAQRGKDFWQNWENIENLIKPHIINGRFPIQTELVRLIKGGIGDAIAYFGGINAVAERMGYKLEYSYKATDGHYLDSAFELIFDEYLYSNGIPHEVNKQISDKVPYRCDFKIGHIYVEIWGYEAGRENSARCVQYNLKRARKETLYKELGLTMISIEADIFKKAPDEIKKHFDELILTNDLTNTVNTESGTVIENTIKSCRYWNEDKIKDELTALSKDLNKFPTQTELMSLGLGGLKDAISRHGGLHYFAKQLGAECERKEAYFWNDENILAEIKKYIEQYNDFPTFNKLEELKKYDLVRAINQHGGLPKFRKILGYPELVKPHDYWSEDLIYEKIKEMATETGKFPLYTELRAKNKTLCSALDRYKLRITVLREKYNTEMGLCLNSTSM